MADQSTPPDAPAPEQAPAASAPASRGIVAEYVSDIERVYHFPGAPVTAKRGDVCELPYLPEDGCWAPTTAAVTRLADNHPDNQPKALDPELVATSLTDHDAILERLGVTQEGAQR